MEYNNYDNPYRTINTEPVVANGKNYATKTRKCWWGVFAIFSFCCGIVSTNFSAIFGVVLLLKRSELGDNSSNLGAYGIFGNMFLIAILTSIVGCISGLISISIVKKCGNRGLNIFSKVSALINVFGIVLCLLVGMLPAL